MEFIINKSYSVSCISASNSWKGEIIINNNGLILGHTDDKIITGVYLENHGIKLRVISNDNYSEYYYFSDNTCIEKKDESINKCDIKFNKNEKVKKIDLNIIDRMQSMCFASKCALLNIIEEPYMHKKDLIKEKKIS